MLPPSSVDCYAKLIAAMAFFLCRRYQQQQTHMCVHVPVRTVMSVSTVYRSKHVHVSICV